MPQATIKLQPAPAAAARKVGDTVPPAATSAPAVATPAAASSTKPAAKAPELSENLAETSDVETNEEEESYSSSELPLPFLIAAAALALIAFGIQLWTFLA